MSSDPSVTDDITTETPEPTAAESIPATENPAPANVPAPKDSYTKLAMRNMVRKPIRSLLEFGLTTVGLLALLIGLSYLTR